MAGAVLRLVPVSLPAVVRACGRGELQDRPLGRPGRRSRRPTPGCASWRPDRRSSGRWNCEAREGSVRGRCWQGPQDRRRACLAGCRQDASSSYDRDATVRMQAGSAAMCAPCAEAHPKAIRTAAAPAGDASTPSMADSDKEDAAVPTWKRTYGHLMGVVDHGPDGTGSRWRRCSGRATRVRTRHPTTSPLSNWPWGKCRRSTGAGAGL